MFDVSFGGVLARVYVFFLVQLRVATFWERVAHSVERALSLLYVYLYVLLFPIWL